MENTNNDCISRDSLRMRRICKTPWPKMNVIQDDDWALLAPRLSGAIEELLPNVDLDTVSVKDMREKLEAHLQLEANALEKHKEQFGQLLKGALETRVPQTSFAESLPTELSSNHRSQSVYLCTIARVLPGTLQAADFKDVRRMTRQQIGDCVRAAFNDPIVEPGQAGRRAVEAEVVKKLAVFQEAHEDGEPHFHIAILLNAERRWLVAKRTLQIRNRLPSHWSASHKQFWSAVRYGAIATCKKPVVDDSPFQWSIDGLVWSLFDAAQEPWNAHCWRQRLEKAERKRLCGELKGKAKFSKLDLTSLIIAKDLKSAADIMAFAQNHGTHKMQEWVCQNQRKLGEFLQEALDWQAARETSVLEKETEWALLCRKAEETCGQGGQCSYANAAQLFFEANSASLDRVELAYALRGVMVCGPSKTTRSPIIIGPSNSGKTTLVVPFDELFGHARVFHKPALNSNFPLVNLSKDKRFLFFDDFRPIEYAQGTIDVGTFLSLFNGHPFEIRQSQAFRHGNEDFAWRKGCCLTAKDQELWEPWGAVSAEDVQHMKNRMHVFTCHAVLKNLRQTDPCVPCMCKWIRDGAAAGDARPLLQPALLGPGPDTSHDLEGMANLLLAAKLPPGKGKALEAELLALGAVNVKEVDARDWQSLTAFVSLLPFEQRRLLKALSNC